MQLILAKKPEENKTFNFDHLKVSNALFILTPLSREQKKDLQALKEGRKLYFYLDQEGSFSSAVGIFKDDPAPFPHQADFIDAAQAAFRLYNYEIDQMDFKGDERFYKLQRESLNLRGTRLTPTYLEIKSVKFTTPNYDDKPIAIVKGDLHRAVDPRLSYLMPDESTVFGKGSFDASKVKAVPMGLYLYPELSPFAGAIKEVAERQKDLYDKLFEARENNLDERAYKLQQAIDQTHTLLRAHVGEIYDVSPEGMVFYIGSSGQWQMEHFPGMRPLDDDDKRRLLKLAETYKEFPEKLRKDREDFARQPLIYRMEISDQEGAIPITSVLAPALMAEEEAVNKRFLDRQMVQKKLTPSKGPLGADDLPGLKPGVELFPHQALLLGSLEGRDRMLIDADPGAGKTLIIICDILRNLKNKKVKRPLVVMPESLLGQFAAEVRQFSELNSWVISTKAIANWQDGELDSFLEDAAKTPSNTVFLTSYNWLARDHVEVPTGDLSKAQDHYKMTKIFPRPETLMGKLGIDGVWMDECHALKNESNQSWAATSLGKLPVVRGLTGTIMPGNPIDVLGPMDVIHSGVFGLQQEFLDRFTLNGTPSAYRDQAPKEIRDMLRSFGMKSLRKSAWAHLLPKVHRAYHYVSLTQNQQKAYDAILRNILDEIQNDPKLSKLLAKFQSETDEDEAGGVGSLLARFVPLDVFLNSPKASKDWVNAILKETKDGVSPKAQKIAEIAQNHLTKSDAGKVLVLVQFKEGAKNILENFPEHLQEVSAYYEGGKIDALARFKDPNDKGVQILVAVDKTLRTGHNIQAANCIIHGDLTWMSGDMSQREGRAVRIGQKRDVFIHQVLASGTAEMLKMARIASAEHLIAKANSDFEDTVMLQPVTMSLHGMTDFRKKDQLDPYIERRKAIEAQVAEKSVEDADFFGKKLLKPRGYESIDSVFKDARILPHVPGIGNFSGRLRDRDEMVEKELSDLPEEAKLPTGQKIIFHLKNWNEGWQLVCFRTVDPQGYLRRFGFNLMRDNFYLQTKNKAHAKQVIEKLQKDLDIVNLDELEDAIGKIRVTTPGVNQGVSKKAKSDKKTVLAAVKGAVTVDFATLDGAPTLYVDTLLEEDAEVKILKSNGFVQEPASWQRDITRGQLVNLLRKIQAVNPKLKIAKWEEFKEKAKVSFRGLDLSEFDAMGVE